MVEETKPVVLDNDTMDVMLDRLNKRKEELIRQSKEYEAAIFGVAGAIQEIDGQLNFWRIQRGLDPPALTTGQLEQMIKRGAEAPK